MSENGKIILDIVSNANNHPTAEDIYQQVRADGKKMSMATVYNNLNLLTKEGLIRRLTIDGKGEHYDKTVRHDHMVCDICGRIRDLKLEDMTAQLESASGEKLKSYDLKLIYVCEQCRKSERGRQ